MQAIEILHEKPLKTMSCACEHMSSRVKGPLSYTPLVNATLSIPAQGVFRTRAVEQAEKVYLKPTAHVFSSAVSGLLAGAIDFR